VTTKLNGPSARPPTLMSVPKTVGTLKSFDDTAIYYEVRGQGRPLIFVYGIACLMNHFHHQIEHFCRQRQVISFDLRGHHKSAMPGDQRTLTVSAMARDILALVEHLDLQEADFVGHSYGVPILIEFNSLAAKEKPAFKVHSLTFINGFAKNPIHGMFGVDYVERLFYLGKKAYQNVPFLFKPLWRTVVENPASALIAGLLGGFNLRRMEWKDIEIYAKAVGEISLDMFLPLFEDMMNCDSEAALREITAPTLVIAGARDLVTPLKFQEDLHKTVQGSSYVVMEGGSHCTQLDFPAEVNRHIEALLNSLD
jgi:pimeloyl-ACP methyl ester carboxylesterase